QPPGGGDVGERLDEDEGAGRIGRGGADGGRGGAGRLRVAVAVIGGEQRDDPGQGSAGLAETGDRRSQHFGEGGPVRVGGHADGDRLRAGRFECFADGAVL